MILSGLGNGRCNDRCFCCFGMAGKVGVAATTTHRAAVGAADCRLSSAPALRRRTRSRTSLHSHSVEVRAVAERAEPPRAALSVKAELIERVVVDLK